MSGRIGDAIVGFALVFSAGCGATLPAVRANHFVTPVPNASRDVRMVVVLDTLWLGGRHYAEEVVARTSRRWENRFGIRFTITATREQHVAGLTAIEQIGHLSKSVSLDDADVVVLFTRSSGLLWPEAAELLGNYVVVAPGLWDSPENMLNHGLGHIFGAGHSSLPAHVMSFVTVPFLSQPSVVSFSGKTTETILNNKWRSFARPHALTRQARKPSTGRR